MPHPVHRLGPADRPALHRHFAALEPLDLQGRFGRQPSADWVRLYVEGIDLQRDALLGVRDVEGGLDGVAHLALFEGAAELGLSVVPAMRRRGIGSALFDRGALHARNRGVVELFMRRLADSRAMRRIARKAGMRVRSAGSAADAWIELPPPWRLQPPGPPAADRVPVAPGDARAAGLAAGVRCRPVHIASGALP